MHDVQKNENLVEFGIYDTMDKAKPMIEGEEDMRTAAQFNKQDEDFIRNFSKKMKQFCCPIFLKEHYFDFAHSDTTPNATMTFIKYENVVYGCTCKHVVENAIKKGKNNVPGALQILAGRMIHNFNTLLVNSKSEMERVYYPAFLIPNNGIDIAIRPISVEWFNEVLAPQKRLKYFDFDDYQKPEYDNIKLLHAFGWLNDHKSVKNGNVETILAHTSVVFKNTINENSTEFQLFDQLKEPHGLSFSGMSGGPVAYCENNLEKIIPIGIIYEGSPGKEKPQNGSIFDSSNYILYQCQNLTPVIFAGILQNSNWNYEKDNKYKNFVSIRSVANGH